MGDNSIASVEFPAGDDYWMTIYEEEQFQSNSKTVTNFGPENGEKICMNVGKDMKNKVSSFMFGKGFRGDSSFVPAHCCRL